jgi:hypothetical protein
MIAAMAKPTNIIGSLRTVFAPASLQRDAGLNRAVGAAVINPFS